MSKVGSWSTTPGNNNSTPPDGWPEGQAPSTVNDCAREMMAQIKTLVNSLEYVDLGNTPSYLTATTFSMATADVANFEVGRRVKLFDASTLYGTIISVSATQVQVRLDSGALTSSLSSIAMAVVKASNNSLPDNVWKRKNVIINGSMDIWQRSATFQAVNSTKTYLADRFALVLSTGGALAVSRSERSANVSNVPSLAQSGVFFNNALLISASAVDAVIAAGEYAVLEYIVEGYDWRQIAHKPMNLSFWVNTNKSGIYAVSMRSSNSSASYVQNFTISAVAIWTKFSLAIPEAPGTPYTWNYSSGQGLAIRWALTAGTTWQGGAGNWTATDLIATASQVNFLESVGNTFAITGIQLEEGQFATPLEVRPYQQELEMCRRYFQTFVFSELPGAIGRVINTTQVVTDLNYATPLRSSPTVTYPIATGFNTPAANDGFNTVSSIATNTVGVYSLRILTTAQNTTLVAGNASEVVMSTLPIQLDAEL
jgi:hypothetical protein